MPGPDAAFGGTVSSGSYGGSPVPPRPSSPENTPLLRHRPPRPERFGRGLNRLHQEVIHRLAATEGVDLKIIREINASRSVDG